ncbi:hypothetical protein KC340_g26 [Hortaea werneckii]|nr:hypothetical protein KC340_g26 [Hortaea werneckii]
MRSIESDLLASESRTAFLLLLCLLRRFPAWMYRALVILMLLSRMAAISSACDCMLSIKLWSSMVDLPGPLSRLPLRPICGAPFRIPSCIATGLLEMLRFLPKFFLPQSLPSSLSSSVLFRGHIDVAFRIGPRT